MEGEARNLGKQLKRKTNSRMQTSLLVVRIESMDPKDRMID